MRLSDFFPDMEGFTPVELGVAKTPQFPNPETQVSPFLRATLPLPLQYSGDTIKQYNRPGMSSFRIAPLPPGGIPTINSTAQGVTNIVNNTVNGSGIVLETDGVKNAVQSVLDIIGGANITAVSDANGGVTISSTGGSTGLFTSRPDFKRWALWSQNGGGGFGGGFVGINDSLTNTVSGTTSATLVGASATDDYGVQLQQSTSTGFSAVTGVQNLIPARAFSLFCPLRVATNSGNIRVWIIVSNPNNSGDVSAIAGSDTPNRDIIGFRYNPAVSPNWFAVQAQVGLGLTAVDTGVAESSTATMFRADYDPATTTSTFFINGLQVATISTNPPTLTFPLGGMISVASTGGTANAINVSSFYTEMRTTVTTN